MLKTWSRRVAVPFLALLAIGCHRDSPEMVEAKQKVAEYMSARFRRCGDNLVTKYPGTPSFVFSEVKNVTWDLKEESITEANRLNGVEFVSTVTVTLSTSRAANAKTIDDNVFDSRHPYHYEWCWYPWHDGGAIETFQLAKVKGKWQYATLNYTSEVIFKEQAPQCSEVDSIKDCPSP
jgi:hypothetical protein